ncbi:hypothetical protein T11_9809 [Trichinella zimbabwensis]|uniref:MULE transposase domain-containing protein n=1 Tax=Trichinella zimbabwensis TaxID=268475 RepID=A0A0V1HSY5_9BILA|nr:hypothetical protein T11_9809 [Trichinella zimbabwensis]
MYHSPTNDILIFATEAGVRLLAQSNCWCGDGTFKIVPSWYQQLFTLHVFMRGKLLPVVYCLTVRKDLPTYSRIFEVLHSKAEELGIQLDPANLDPGNSRQLSQQPVAKFLPPLFPGQVEVLIEYFQRERLPAPKIPLWNVHGVVAVRTNNHLEGCHKRAQKH